MILRCDAGNDPAAVAAALERAWRVGALVGLAGAGEAERLAAALGPDPAALAGRLGLGPGVVVGSGGSSGARRWCVQPLAHLQASAAATATWLQACGMDPGACLHLNSLPLHHVSGLLPVLRARLWGASLRWLPPPLLRQPAQLAAAVPLPRDRPVLLSLVPTQLARLLADGHGRAWLAGCRLIWVGGAPLPPALAAQARRAALPLAPCYGATETAAMVAALEPERFLAGDEGCGRPLADVRLRLGDAEALEVAAGRLSPGWLEGGALRPLPLAPGGWWRSGDAASLAADGALRLRGRLDGALLSGGVTVFPEALESRLLEEAAAAGLAVEAVLLLGEDDPEWGQRLVALVRPAAGLEPGPLLAALAALVAPWPPAERPRRWLPCPELAPSAAGKWERGHWRRRLAACP
ncbi:MAG: AMP-binding protein [Synechococcaceae cyanobacterium]|nr:AMP-binding protein [Synechococcaceae cyanobacterium]